MDHPRRERCTLRVIKLLSRTFFPVVREVLNLNLKIST
jgi:hypothetical protein